MSRCPGCGYTNNTLGATSCKLCGSPMDQAPGGRGAPAAAAAPRAAARARPAGLASGTDRWMRYMLVRLGGAPVELKVGQTFSIGRATDCDLTVPSQRVSRRHAEVIWKDGKAFLRDLGSQNGSQVNGRPVQGERELTDGDELTVGPYTCTYRAVSVVGSVGKTQEGAELGGPTVAMVGETLTGTLQTMSVAEVLDTLEHNQKTGTLELFSEEEEATMVIEDGYPVFARAGGLEGLAAARALLGWTEGTYRFRPEVEEEGRNIQGLTIAELIAQGA